jgi:DNA-binding transcriptional ArsR family regulator
MAPENYPPGSIVRLDSARVRTLAHPLRNRLLSALRRNGPSTATTLARELDTNSGATSYHLRRLAEVGLVSDTGEGRGKERFWAAASDYTSWDPADFEGDEDAETALNWLERDYLRHMDQRFEKWLDVENSWPMPWRSALGMSDDVCVLTAEQAEAMNDELAAVVQKWRRAGQADQGARRVAVYRVLYPVDLDRRPRG